MFGKTERVKLTKKLHNYEFDLKFNPETKSEENPMLPTDLFLREQLEEPRPQEEHVRAIIMFSMSRGKNRPPPGS